MVVVAPCLRPPTYDLWGPQFRDIYKSCLISLLRLTLTCIYEYPKLCSIYLFSMAETEANKCLFASFLVRVKLHCCAAEAVVKGVAEAAQQRCCDHLGYCLLLGN